MSRLQSRIPTALALGVHQEELDPDCEYGDELCKEFNNDTILEVLRIGFRQKFGKELK